MSDEDKHGLNLGFEDLLSNRAEERQAEGQSENQEETRLSFEETLKTQEEAGKRIAHYDELWNQKEYNDLIVATEKVEAENDNPLLRKFWWIRAQIAKDELPSQVLCSSLEEALQEEHFDKVPLSLAQETATELALKLTDQREEGLAIAILDRMFKVAPSSDVAHMLLTLIKNELDELPKRVTFHSPSEMKKRLYLLDLKRSIDEFLKVSGAPFDLDLTAEITNSDLHEKEAERHPKKQSALFKGLLIGLFSVAVSALYIYYVSSNSNESFAGAVEPGKISETLLRPELVPVRDVSQLTALMYDVERSEKNAVEARETAVPVKEQTAPTVIPTPKPKLTLDLSGPTETEKIRQILERKNGTSYDDIPDERPRFPRDDRHLAPGPLVRPSDESLRDRERQLDTGRAQAWEGGQRYEVLINTSVMDKPSFHANEVAELYVGDRVLVEARLGRWLRLRSVKGKSGYILAQDAEKLYE